MWINIRTFCGTKQERFDGLSKLTTINTLREKIHQTFDIPPQKQKLFYRGKLLVDQHSLFDYNVAINDTIQLMITKTFNETETLQTDTSEAEVSREDCTGLYNISEEVDVFDPGSGAWFEGVVKQVYKEIRTNNTSTTEQLYYLVKLDGYDECDNMNCKSDEIRPRAHLIIPVTELKVGQKYMINHNFDHPEERGFWYDASILSVVNKNKNTSVKAEVYQGSIPIEIQLQFTEDVFRIESRGDDTIPPEIIANIAKRESAPNCIHCKDNDKRKCKYCACSICGKKENPDKILLCDECDYAFHLYCLKPKLTAVPEEDNWYCVACKNDDTEIVRAGEGLKVSKRRSNAKSATTTSTRDWGKGMACQGRTKVCTIVPQNHTGPVPGIPVGSMWKYRLQVSEVGVHRPHVAGIHGREAEGAYSIVLSGGYEDDKDNGEEFYYTGSGGRDLSGNKRTAEQSCDQKLSKMNLALARCCDAPIDNKKGAEAKNWNKGLPIRVVRNCKLAKHSKYAPKEGNRYDGIYKLVKYWPEKGRSGFLVWRYLLRRDDEAPAPWTKAGIAMTQKLGLKIIYPDGYQAKGAKVTSEDKENVSENKSGKRKRTSVGNNLVAKTPKLVLGEKKHSNQVEDKQESSKIDDKLKKLIERDTENSKKWNELLADHISSDWHELVSDNFTCICCTDVVYKPITTPCKHIMCQQCMARSYKAQVYSCPVCRFDLGKEFQGTVNDHLQNVLLEIFPGYNIGR